MESLKVAIAGFGFGGRIFHAPFIQSTDGLVIDKILTTDPAKIAGIQKAYPHVKIAQSFEDILSDPDIAIVVLAVPNTFHHDMATQALQAGKHVVVEKPFTVTSEQADALIRLAQNGDRILTVYHNRRLDSDFRTVKKVIEKNLLGRVVEYEAHYDRFRNYIKDSWKQTIVPGGGILYDLGAHLIDQALTLFGLPTEIYADLRLQRDEAVVVDNFELILSYPNLKATLKAGMLVKERGPRFAVFGTEGTFLKHGMDVQEAALLNGLRPDGGPWGIEPREIWGKLNTSMNDVPFVGRIESETGNYNQFYQNLYQAIKGEESLLITPESARDVIRVIETAYQSNKEGRRLTFG